MEPLLRASVPNQSLHDLATGHLIRFEFLEVKIKQGKYFLPKLGTFFVWVFMPFFFFHFNK